MDGKSLDTVATLKDQLSAIIPEAFSEGKIDWEKLKAALGEAINFSNERYVLNWAGKSDAFKVMQAPTSKTLMPARDESVNFDETENIFIEGENLEVLKALQKSYFGKIKMIYIDPPYNTGNDSFIYPDKFSETKEEYQKRVGDKDEEGYMTKDGMFHKNSKENGQYHSNWLNMMYPRLFMAKNLLTEDGIIFISIGDDEFHNLLSIANEIFGEENKLANFCWRSDGNIDNQAKVKYCHEYIIAFAKNIDSFPIPEVIDPNIDESSKLFKNEIRNTIIKNGVKNPIQEVLLPKGFPANFEKGIIKKDSVNFPKYSNDLEIENFKLKSPVLAESGWSAKRQLELFIESGFNKVLDTKNQEVDFELTENGAIETVKTRKENQSHVISFINNVGTTQSMGAFLADRELYFDYPKPTGLLKYLISMINGEDFIVLDFFAGSGTTAHALLDLNKDGKKRKFISVQLDENIEEDSKAKKAGYDTISSMSIARIKKCISEIKEENNQAGNLFSSDQDLGFKVFKLSESNFKQWQPKPKSAEELAEQMKLFVNPINGEPTNESMAFELLLKSGLDLNSTIEEKGGFYLVNDNELALVLSETTESVFEAIAAHTPKRVIALDIAFKGNDQLKTNVALQLKDAGINFKTI